MEYKAPGKSVNNSRLLTGTHTSKTKCDDNKKKRTESLKQNIASKHSFASRKNLLQSSQGSNSVIPFHEEKSESNHRDAEKKQQAEKLQATPQQSDTQIPNTTAGTASIGAIDTSETCQNKIQKCNLSRRGLSNDTLHDCIPKPVKIDSHIDVTSTNRRDISAERSDIKAASGSSSSKDESMRKLTENFVCKPADKNCSENKTVFAKDKYISVKKANVSVSQKCSSSKDKSDTIVPIRLKKHYFDSKKSINFAKDDNVFEREYEEKKKNKIEAKQKFSSIKIKLTGRSQECSYESRNNTFLESNVSSSRNAIISESKIYPKVKSNNLTNENASILEKHIQTHVDLELVERIDIPLCQTPTKKNVNQTKINLESKNPIETDNPIKISSEAIIKRKISFESLNSNISPIKIRKKNEINMSSSKVVTNNIEMLSDKEIVHTKQEGCESIAYNITKRENYKLKRKREHRKERNKKIKHIRKKLHKYFRGTFDPDTSESEEECQILSNHLKRRKLKRKQSDDLLYDIIEKDIFKRNKKLVHDTSVDSFQKDVENAMPTEIKFDSISTKKCSIYGATTDEKSEDESICKRRTTVENLQKNTENIDSNNLCNSITSTEEYYPMHDATTKKKIKDKALICTSDMSFSNSQKNVESGILVEAESDNSFNSVSTEKYVMHDATTDEEMEDGTSVCDRTSDSKSQKNRKYPLTEVISDNSCNSTVSTEENYPMQDATTKKKIRDKASICTSDMSPNNSQKNVESAMSVEVKSDNLFNSASTEKYVMHDATIDEEMEDGTAICDRTSGSKSQKNRKYALTEVISDNSCNSTASTEENYPMQDITTKKKIRDKATICTSDISLNNSRKNVESGILVEAESDNSFNSASTEKYVMHDATDEDMEDGTSVCDRTSGSKSQKNRKYPSTEVISDNSCNSTASTEENYPMQDTTTKKKIRDKATICTSDMSSNNSRKKIESAISVEVKSDNSCNSASTEKYVMHDATKDEEMEDGTSVTEKNYPMQDTTTKKKIRYKASICTSDMSPNNSQKNVESAMSVELKSDNSFNSASTEKYVMHDATTNEDMEDGTSVCDRTTGSKSLKNRKYPLTEVIFDNSCNSTASTEENYPMQDTTTKKKIRDKASICTSDMSPNNSQKNVESVMSVEVKSDNLFNSASTEKYVMHDATTDEEMEDGTSVCDRTSGSKSQKNRKYTLTEVISDNSCNSTASTEENYPMQDITTKKKIRDKASICTSDMSPNNSQKNVESAMSVEVKSDNLFNSASTEKYVMHDATIDEEMEDGTAICDRTSGSKSQKNRKYALTEVISDNSCNSTASTEENYPMQDITTKKKIRDKASICTSDMSPNNSQKNVESAMSVEVKSDNLFNSASTEKYVMHDATIDEEMEDGTTVCDRTSGSKSQKNRKYALTEVISDNSCNSTASTDENYPMQDITTKKKIRDKASICTSDISLNNSRKNVESGILVEAESDNSCNSTTNIEKCTMHDVKTDEMENEASLGECGTVNNNSQENIKSAISINVMSEKLNDSTVCMEKNYALHNATKDKEIDNRASVYECGTIINNSEKKCKVLAKEQHVESSKSIIDTENNSKSDACAEPNEDIIPSPIEIDLDENMSIENIYLNQNVKKKADIHVEAEKLSMPVIPANREKDQEVCNIEKVDLMQSKNMQNRVTSNLELPISSTHESTSCDVGEENSCDMSQNITNILLISKNNAKDKKIIDQLSVTASTSDENSLEIRYDESLSNKQTRNLSSSTSNDNHSNDSHLADDDNNSDIEIEIKIKPKLKSRILRKFSLKAPWSAVNTCIKNLHTLKDNPSFLNNLFQMDHKISEKFKCKSTNKSLENDTLLDDNENVETVEVEDCYIVCDSGPITKDNVSDFQQQRNLQDYLILNKNENAMDSNKKGNDERTDEQSVNAITIGNNQKSSELVCDTFDLEKQLQKTFTDNKQKTNEDNNTTLEEIKSMAEHTQGKDNECTSSKQQKTQMMENNPESGQTAYDMLNVEQLPRNSPDTIHNKVRVRSIAELNYRCALKSINLNASAPKSACSIFCQLESSQSALPQSIPQSISPQSPPSQPAPPQPAPPQLAPPQPAPPQPAPLQPAPLQSAPPQPAPPQPAPPQPAPPQPAPPQPAPPQSSLLQSALQSSFQPILPRLLSPQSIRPQLVPQSVSKQPSSYNTAVRHMYHLPRANVPVPVEINTPSINNSLINLIRTTEKNIYTNIGYCRNIIRSNFLRIHVRDILVKYIQKMCVSVTQINQGLESLKLYLCTNDIEYVITYINQHIPLNQQITIMELKNYINIVQSYTFYYILRQNKAKSNASQQSNIDGSVPNVSMPNVNTQSFSRDAPVPDARILNRGKSMQSSTIPRPIIPNVNQQQLYGNSTNSPQIPHPRQPIPNIRQYTHYVPSAHSRMPNANQQQSLGNASYSVHDKHMSSVDMSNVGVQQGFVNTNNVSFSNTNMRSYEPVNQGNANISPAINTRQLYAIPRNPVTHNTAINVSAANAQQQMHFQASQVNSGTTIRSPPATNRNISPGIHNQAVHNVMLSALVTANPDASKTDTAMRNVRYANVNQQQLNSQQVSQVSSQSSERAQYNSYQQNQNEFYYSNIPQSNMSTHSTQNIQADQNIQLTLQQKLQKNQRLMRSKDTSICPTDITTDISQNVPQIVNVNEGAEIFKSQNKNCIQKKTSTNPPQDLRQEISSNFCSTSQNTFLPKTSTSQRPSILQNTMFKISHTQNDNTILTSTKSTLAESQVNEITYNFDSTVLTDIQKIVFRKQIQSYFLMPDFMKYSLNEQEFERTQHERIIFLFLFQNLYNYIKSVIKESQTGEKCVAKDSQDNTSQNRSILQENTMQTSASELTKIQSSRDNEIQSNQDNRSQNRSVLQENTIQTSANKSTKIQSNRNNEDSSACNRILEKQCSEQSIDSDISKNSEPMAVKDTRLQKQNDLPKVFQKSSLVDTENRPESIEASLGYSRTSEANSITEMCAKNSEMETQDNAKIKSLKASSPGHSQRPEENSIAEMSAKNSETQANAKVNQSLEVLLLGHLRTSEKNSITEVPSKNSETEVQDKAKVDESLKVTSSYNKQSPNLRSLLTQNLSNSQDTLAEKTEDQSEIAKSNTNEKSNNTETESIREACNKVTLNNSKDNDATSRVSYNVEDQNKVYSASNEVFSKNIQNEIRDDVNENIKILNSTEIQSDSLSTSRDLIPALSNNVCRSISPTEKCEFMEISQIHDAREEHSEISQQDFMNERNDKSTEEMYNENFGKLYIDESVEESQDQYDKISSSEEDNVSTLQDSPRPFDAIRCDSTEAMPLSPLKNMVEVTDTPEDFVTEARNIDIFNEELLEARMQQEISLKFEDEWNMGGSTTQPINIMKKAKDVKEEDSEESLFEVEEMKLEEIQVLEEALSTEESVMQSINLKLPEDMEKNKVEIDTHSSVKMINEQLKHVSEQEYYKKSRISSPCNSIPKDDSIDINVEKVFTKNDNVDDIECISVKSDDSEVTIMPNILNIRSISPSLFEKIENMDTVLQSNSESSNDKDEKLLDINDNLGIPDEDDRPCLRCKRKSMVYCQACLEAHYCSKRCSSLHWNAEHYKECKGRNSIICIDI